VTNPFALTANLSVSIGCSLPIENLVDELHYNDGNWAALPGGCVVPADLKPTEMTAQEKPVLDREAFQQLLAAAYVLQEQNDRPASPPPRPDYTEAVSELVEIQSLIQTHQVDLPSAASLIASRAQRFTGADGAAVGLLKDDELTYHSATGIASEDGGMPVTPAASLSAHSLTRGQIIQSLDAQRDRRIPGEACRRAGVQSFISVPALHDGKVAGVVELRFSNKNGFQEQEVRTCQLMTGLWAEAIARSAELEWKQALATERATMIEALERIKPQLERIAVEPGTEAVASPMPVEPPATTAETEVVCRACGHELEMEESYCGLCGAPRPSADPASGDLQSKWASLWHLKQAANIRKSEVPEGITSEESSKGTAATSTEDEDGLILEQNTTPETRILPATVQGSAPVSTPATSSAPWTSASRTKRWLETIHTPPRRAWLARNRANIYLAASAVLLFVVIAGWGSHSNAGLAAGRRGKNAPAPPLSLFETMLVDLGLAVPPPSPVYRGNPDTRVWEDERTALYYCPGADLYGKTERGKFSTQRDAQQDQFEPASRRPCD
jgi:hypothetical protein